MKAESFNIHLTGNPPLYGDGIPEIEPDVRTNVEVLSIRHNPNEGTITIAAKTIPM